MWIVLSKNNKLLFFVLIFLAIVFSVIAIAADNESSEEKQIEDIPELSAEEIPPEQEIPAEDEITVEKPVEKPANETVEENITEDNETIDEDHNKGHGNDEDGCDEDNSGNSGRCKNETAEEINETIPIEEDIELNETQDNQTEEEIITEPKPNNETDINETEEDILINQTEPINETLINETEEPEEPNLIKTILNLILDKLSFIKGELINIKAYLSYENETPIPDKQVDFYANNMSIGTEITDDSGLAEIDWDTSNISPGTYTISADYSGDGVIEGRFNSVEINLSDEIDEVILNETVSENIINETQINETLNLTEVNLINETLNLTEINSTLNLTNETIINETLINITNTTNGTIRPAKIRSRFNFYFYKYSSEKGVHETEDTDDEIPKGLNTSFSTPRRIFNINTLAPIVNGHSIDTPEIKEYLNLHNNFSNIKIENILESTVKAKIGNFIRDNIKGIGLNNKSYIIHVTYCDEFSNSCILKVNGIKIGKIYNSEIKDETKLTEFELDNTHSLKIKSIIFDYCDGRRFCDYHFDAYDIVEIEVENVASN